APVAGAVEHHADADLVVHAVNRLGPVDGQQVLAMPEVRDAGIDDEPRQCFRRGRETGGDALAVGGGVVTGGGDAAGRGDAVGIDVIEEVAVVHVQGVILGCVD